MSDSRLSRRLRNDRHTSEDAKRAAAGYGEPPAQPHQRADQGARSQTRNGSGASRKLSDYAGDGGRPREPGGDSHRSSRHNDPRAGEASWPEQSARDGRQSSTRSRSNTRSQSESRAQSRSRDMDWSDESARSRDDRQDDRRHDRRHDMHTRPSSRGGSSGARSRDEEAQGWPGDAGWGKPRREDEAASYYGSDRSSRHSRSGQQHRAAEAEVNDGWHDRHDRHDGFGNGYNGYAADEVNDRRLGAHTEWHEAFPDVLDGVKWPGDNSRQGGGLGRRFGATLPSSDTPRKRFPRTKRQRMIVIGAAICLGLCLLTSVSTAIAGALWYSSVSSHLKSAEAHLASAQTDLKALSSNPFNTATISSAQDELQGAHDDFVQLQQSIGQMPGFLSGVPRVGSELDVARKLVPVGVEATQAGILGTQALGLLATELRNPFDTKSPGVSPSDIATINQDMNQINPLVQDVLARLSQVNPSDVAKFNAKAGKLVASLRTQLPQVQQTVSDFVAAIKYLPSLLGVGQPSKMFLTLLDSAELRPGGGFIGSYGFATLKGGHIADMHFQDIDLLDRVTENSGLYIPIPSQYQWFDITNNFGVRDSNMEPDFATDMHIALNLYDQEVKFSGGTPEQPVAFVAITPYLIQSMLKITGPITLPEYQNLVVSADNLIYQIHYHQLTPGVVGGPDTVIDPKTGTSLRKEFTGFLFKHFMDAVKAHAAKDLGPLIKVMLTGIQTKDMQIAFPTPTVQKVLSDLKLDSTVRSRPTGDTSFIADANISGSKSNYDIVNSVQDDVTLNAAGDATHHMTITYNWPDNKQTQADLLFGNSTYRDYLRLYAPTGAKLSSANGWSPRQQGTAYNDSVWAGFFSFLFPGTYTVSFVWTVPHAATLDGNRWSYDYLIQHQAGWTRHYTVSVTVPAACSAPTSTPTDPLVAIKPAGAHGVQAAFTLARDEDEVFQYQC